MNIVYILILAFPFRPECPPITARDIRSVFILENLYQNSPQGKFIFFPESLAPSSIPGRFVIGFDPHTKSNLIEIIQSQGWIVKFLDTSARFLVIETPVEFSLVQLNDKLTDIPGIRFIEPDYPVRSFFLPNDPLFLTTQWDKWVMYADQAWDIVKGGTIKVAVVDNGVDYTHHDLRANFATNELGYDFVAHDNDPRPDNPNLPNAFHGSHVAGIIGAVTDNLIGVAGWAQIQLLAVRVLNDSGNGSLSDVALGIRWAVDHGARVINLSLGGDAATTPLNEACTYAISRGVILFAAAGNDGRASISYPARLSNCVCVGALNESSNLASFSNYGPEQELAAPGVLILSTAPDNSYLVAQGTSMSCPEVSGIAALILSLTPDISPAQLRAILAVSAIDIGPPGKDPYFGYGIVNAYRALELARAIADEKRIGHNTSGQRGFTQRDSFCGKTIFTQKKVTIPKGVQKFEALDPTGRPVLKKNTFPTAILLPRPGIYFLILHSENQRSYPVKVLTVR
ncbi:MAG: S8 family peptidase [bacterium]